MSAFRALVVAIAALGVLATAAASALFWLMLTRPIATAGLFGWGL